MADFKATAQLNIEAVTDQAQSNVLALSELMRRKLNPDQYGEFTPTQDAALNQALQQRAAALSTSRGVEVTPEEVRKELEDINNLQQQLLDIEKQRTAARQENNDKIEKARQEEELLVQQKKEALDLMKMQSGEWRDINRAAKAVLDNQDATQAEREEAQKTLDLYHETVKTRQRLNTAVKASERSQAKFNQLTADYQQQLAKIKADMEALALTEEEREDIQTRFLDRIEEELRLRQEVKTAQAEVNRLSESEAKAKEEIADAERELKDSFAGKITSAYLYFQALNAVKRVVRAAIRTITELDKALTDIAVVTSFNREQTWALLDTYQEMAKQVGLTTTEVANLSIAFFRQGREAADALRLTQTAAEFAKIAAINVNDAANFLTAAINGFNLAASDASRIVDRFAALGASAAASAAEIAIALSKVAPAAASAGVEVDTLMAFVTKGIETTREAPENIGTAFKTIFARMRELTDIGKTVEDGMDVNRVEASLRSIGVELRDANGEFRNLDDVLIDVGKRWDGITRNQQAYLATTLAGTRQQTRLIALFENFDRTLELIQVSQNSAGVAAIQHAEYMQGLEAATTRLRTSFQQLITSFVNSDIVIGFINAINTTLELMNTTLAKIVLTVGTLIASIRILTTTKVKAFALGIVNSFLDGKADLAIKGFFQPITTAWNVMIRGFIYGEARASKIIPLIGRYFQVMFTNGFHPIQATTQAFWKLMTALQSTQLYQKSLIPILQKFNIVIDANTRSITRNNTALAMSPLALKVMAIVAVVTALTLFIKKMREADGTTNELVSALKQFFDNIGRFISKVGKGFVNFFTSINQQIKKMSPALKVILNLLSLFVPGLRLIGIFNLTRQLFGAAGINLQQPISRAASQMRVLNNRVKDLNKKLRESQQEAKKLEKALDEYKRLEGIIFKTKKETEELVAAQERLQELLGINLTGRGLEIFARAELDKQKRLIEQKLKELDDLVQDYFAKQKGVNWKEALNDEQFKEFLDVIPSYAQEFAKKTISEFEKYAPDIQEAILAAVAIDPEGFLDLSNMQSERGGQKLSTEQLTLPALSANLTPIVLPAGMALSDMLEEAVRQGFVGSQDELLDMIEAAVGGREGFFSNNWIDAYAKSVANAVVASDTLNTNFAEGVRLAKNINLDTLPAGIANAIDLVAPNIRALGSFTEDELERIGETGGAALIKGLQPVVDAIKDDMFIPTVRWERVDDVRGMNWRRFTTLQEDAAEIARKAVLDAATSENSEEAIYMLWRNASRTGMIDGMTLDPSTSRQFTTALENTFAINLDRDIFSVTQLREDFSKLRDIVQKVPSALSPEDLEILSKYPQLFTDYMNGAVGSLGDYFDTAKQSLIDTLDNNAKNLKYQQEILEDKRALNEIDEQAYQIQKGQLQNQINTNNALREMLNFNAANLDAIKAQIDSYKKSFAEAKKIRDLQEESANLTQKSIDAIRRGATGTIEAEFNRTKLNQEIANANRQLEENLIMAQLEAQQKILEDQQQRRIQAATEANTVALNENRAATATLADVMSSFFNSSGTIRVGTGASAIDMSFQDWFDQFNQYVSVRGGR